MVRDPLPVLLSMSTEYYVGDVVHLDVLGQPIIVLGSHEAAVDLLEKRSANYSDRPTFVLGEMYAEPLSYLWRGSPDASMLTDAS